MTSHVLNENTIPGWTIYNKQHVHHKLTCTKSSMKQVGFSTGAYPIDHYENYDLISYTLYHLNSTIMVLI